MKRRRVTFENLPEELLRDILIRLPIKPLVRVRVVRKAWNTCITDHEFALAHMERNKRTMESKQLLCYEYSNPARLRIRESDTLKEVSRLCLFKRQSPADSRVVSYINGVLLIHTNHTSVHEGKFKLILWNPSIRKEVVVPPNESFEGSRAINFGFGFHSSSKDYIIVAVIMTQYKSKTRVYSLRTRTWSLPKQKKCPFPNFRLRRFSESKNVEDGIYWLGRDNFMPKFLCYNMSTEVFSCINMPDLEYGQQRLAVLNNSLALLNFDHAHLCVWVREKCGSSYSWSRKYGIDLEVRGLVYLKNNDEILSWYYPNKVVNLYDVNSMQLKFFPKKRWISTLYVDPYIESLVLCGVGEFDSVGVEKGTPKTCRATNIVEQRTNATRIQPPRRAKGSSQNLLS